MSKQSASKFGRHDLSSVGLTFDDVSLEPCASSVVPTEVSTATKICGHELKIPILSAAMDTVTEAGTAVAIAQLGGLGIMHRNLSVSQQCDEVRSVKQFEAGMIVDPITILHDQSLGVVMDLMDSNKISGVPVLDHDNKLVGIITNRDVRFVKDDKQPVSSRMTSEGLVFVDSNVTQEEAERLLHKHRIEKLLVVNKQGHCCGLLTVKDMERRKLYPEASKDKDSRLLCAAAIGSSDDDIARAEALVEAGCDILVVDTAHGQASRVLKQIEKIAKKFKNNVGIIGGNVATSMGARDLISAGVDAVKVGVGPGTICTTRVIAGVGVPQLTAIMDCAEECRKHKIALIADGGIKFSGDIVKAMAAGADAVMIGSLFAGTDEAPGEIFVYQGRSYKSYRGMGSAAAMARGSADRYFQQEIKEQVKYVPEGVEGRVPYRGKLSNIVNQLVGGLAAGMGYTGSPDLASLRKNARFVKVSQASLVEAHVHDVAITKASPNYNPRGTG